jgi:hypothetical protein
LLLASCARAQTLSGAFSHVADSDGTRPSKGKSVTLTFNPGGACHVVATDASGAEKTVTGDGTYSARAGRITLSLPVLELSVANQPYTLQGDNLTLPFLLFNEGAGTSQWVRVASGMGPGAKGSGQVPPTPPPIPPDQMGDLDQPAPPPPPQPQKVGGGMNDELLCTCTDKGYDTPVQVLKNCTRPSLGKPMCGAVLTTSKQPCSALQNTGGFKTLYDQVVLGRPGPLSGIAIPAISASNPKNPYTILIGTLISTFYKPWTPSDFYMTVQSGGKDDVEYAHVEELRPTQHYLVVRGAAFTDISPAALIASIGHEMIHAEQLRRPHNKPSVGGLGDIVAAMNELEASSWETRFCTFGWKIGPNSLWSCETAVERDHSSALRSCREWQVRELLVQVNKNSATQQFFAQWVDQNPWAKTNWLPKNRGWRKITRNDSPSTIPSPCSNFF